MNTLEKARIIINTVDQEMAILFEQRMQAVEDVVSYKIEQGLPVFDATREQEVIKRNLTHIKQDTYREYYKEFMNDVMRISRDYQNTILHQEDIAYAGTLGAFSHIAAMKVFPNAHHIHYPDFDEVVQAVESGNVGFGVLPFENSYTGEVGEIMDMFLEHNIYIEKMYDLKISQNLLGLKGAKLTDIKTVYSKDQAISQSRKFLQGRGYEEISYPNTALAAKYVVECGDVSKAAIASKETAQLYGLDILAADINTSTENTTRFIAVSNTLKDAGSHVAILFTLPHEAGALVKVMSLISEKGLNMESIHSRSLKDKAFAYYFYVEIIENIKSSNIQELLKGMEEICESVRIVGSFDKESRDEK